MNASARRSAVSTLFATLAVALSWTGAFGAEPLPEGIHVAFGYDPTSTATISWHTDETDPGTHVEYGETPALGLRAQGTARALPQNVGVMQHEVALADLPPGSTIHYRVGTDGAWSPVHAFRTAPVEPATFRFTVFGDHGIKAQSRRTVAHVVAAAPDFHMVSGDLSYATSSTPKAWNTWFELMQPLAARAPLMPAPGNHDTQNSETGSATAQYRGRFALPGQELYYSFDYGRVHFVVVHSTLESVDGRETYLATQLPALEIGLRNAAGRRDAGELDFIVVVQHHPLYGNQEAGVASNAVQRQVNPAWIALEEHLLHRYGVDLLIAGHNHMYERTKPMRYGSSTTSEASTYTDPEGFIEVITGGGGQSLYDFRDPATFPEWSASYARRYHYVEFEVTPGEIRARAIATDEQPDPILDEWTLRKPASSE